MITIALPKGRLAEQTIDLLRLSNIISKKIDVNSRKLIINDKDNRIKFILVKPFDVPTYVEHGIADIGISGKDVLMETNKNVFELVDLKIGKCNISIAGPKGKKNDIMSIKHKKVATKFVNITNQYFNQVLNEDVEIIKLNGSVELAPILGLADIIVDIVESGKTLKENNLEVYEKLYDITARLIVNRASLKMDKKNQINKYIDSIERMINNENSIL
ncbi:ATP phosphoribosyltransferase [Caldicellulosiruptoraceae bacterium PP1]